MKTKPRDGWLKMLYTGRRKAMFKERGPATRTLYRIPGQGFTFYADPQDVYGVGGRCKGFKDWPGYEVVV